MSVAHAGFPDYSKGYTGQVWYIVAHMPQVQLKLSFILIILMESQDSKLHITLQAYYLSYHTN